MVLSVLSVLPAAGTPQMVSLVFQRGAAGAAAARWRRNSRRKLGELAGNHLIIDERGGNTMGSETRCWPRCATARSTWGPSRLGREFRGAGIRRVRRAVPVSRRRPAKAVADGPVGPEVATHFAAKGLVLLAIGKQGFRHITNSRRPIRTPAERQGPEDPRAAERRL